MEENKKERKSFFSWFRNVFLYHYLGPTVIVLAVLGFGWIFIHESMTNTKPDFTVVVGSIDIWNEQSLSGIISVVKDEVGDANGDGKIDVALEIYTPTLDKADETGQQNLQALDLAFMSDPGKVFFIFDEELSKRYQPDYFEYLKDYGIKSADDPFYKVNDLPVFKSILVNDTPYYMCIKGWKESEKNNKEYIHTYDLAVRVLKRLMEAK